MTASRQRHARVDPTVLNQADQATGGRRLLQKYMTVLLCDYGRGRLSLDGAQLGETITDHGQDMTPRDGLRLADLSPEMIQRVRDASRNQGPRRASLAIVVSPGEVFVPARQTSGSTIRVAFSLRNDEHAAVQRRAYQLGHGSYSLVVNEMLRRIAAGDL